MREPQTLNLKRDYVYKEFIRQENNILRAPYNPELEFYSAIKAGDIEKTKELCRESIIDKEGLGVLSKDKLRNYKYHMVITLALIARYCIAGGMDVSTAYGLSDFYIQKVDEIKRLEEFDIIHYTAATDYAKRMRQLRRNKICSKSIADCIDYIYDHLHTRITMDDLSEHTKLTPTYLSRLFKKETGFTVTDYIQSVKIETASNMLIYSEHTPAQIAAFLAFPSQSYFTEVFRKRTGMTPKQYQSANLRKMNQ